MMITPLVSIIMPTHNRSQYAYYAIRSVLAIQDIRLELVVSDTSIDGKLKQQLTDGCIFFNDTRFKYYQPEIKLDMTGNHNFALARATGIYVCLIGDDDTITSDLIDAAEWANSNDINIVSPKIVSNYAWPDFRSKYFGMGHAARLYVPKKLGAIRQMSTASSLQFSLGNAVQGTDGLPKLYHGLVKKNLLDVIHTVSENYFHGSSPDVSIGLALAATGGQNKYIEVEYPLTIPGASAGSNTGRSAEGKHVGKLANEKQTESFQGNRWSQGVPAFFSVETVFAQSGLETLRQVAPDKMSNFNYPRLLALCKTLHSQFSDEILLACLQASEIMGISENELQMQIEHEKSAFWKKRMKYVLGRMLRPTASGGRKYIGNIKTIEEAGISLKRYMQTRNWNWKRFVSEREIACC